MLQYLLAGVLLLSFGTCTYSPGTTTPECATACSRSLMLHQGISPPDTRGDSTALDQDQTINPVEEICGVMLRPCSEEGQAPNDSQNAPDNEQSIPPPYRGDQENDGPGNDNSEPTESNTESPHLGTITLSTQMPITKTIVVTGFGPDMGDEKGTSASANLTPTPSFVRADGPPGLVTPVPSLVESSDTQRSQEVSPLLLAGLYLGLMMSLAAFIVSPEAIVSIVALVLLIRLMRDRL
ncbi:uncharacterized protein B0J16DRAFT_384433 [Fusarium flagelliforme]|uniref:uncharacterized protein n=1 Tax=Fusarium flagelliforme TaxID=2675880 RepID=UPI001E8E2695|nr:uncharacterized protein B0J16DRAFT_384433 [Fusarium flagelliforme]KAH7185381.1 hypothetical protein B0J16DRAFT_384433 [Fusarium flagelliforme]